MADATSLGPNRSKQVGVVGNDNSVAITVPSPSTIPDPEQTTGIATTDATRLSDGN